MQILSKGQEKIKKVLWLSYLNVIRIYPKKILKIKSKKEGRSPLLISKT